MFESDAIVITGTLVWETQDEFTHDPLHLLDAALTDDARDQTWFHLGGANYLIQNTASRPGELELVVNVVGVADANDMASNVLLLG